MQATLCVRVLRVGATGRELKAFLRDVLPGLASRHRVDQRSWNDHVTYPAVPQAAVELVRGRLADWLAA